MKKNFKSLIILLFVISLFPPTTFAEESERYILVEENKTSLIEYMKQQNIEIEKDYSSLPILNAKLTQNELKSIKNKFPYIQIQQNITYETTAESELPSLPTIKAERTTTSPYTGRGVSVAVLDTGIDTEHRDLKVTGGYCSPHIKCASGTPFDDNNGHGTHVAGIIAALNNNTGVVGIAPLAKLYSIKVLNEMGAGTTLSIIDGIEWAIKRDIDILNLSIATTTNDPAMEAALEEAYNKGMILVSSAGNRGKEGENTVTYPAKYPSVIAVGAVNYDLSKLYEGSVGEEVEVAAPGGSVLSTYPVEWDFDDDKSDGYTKMTGTSMASPHVAGLLALYKERFPNMTNVELRKLISQNTRDLGAAGKDPIFGNGLIQYTTQIANTTAMTLNETNGKATLSFSSSVSKVEVNGRQLSQNSNGAWELYGVAGELDIFVTTSITERKYAKLTKPIFNDVKNTQWFSEHIGYLSFNKQIEGYTDDTFRPYEEITRGQAAALIGRALGYSGKPIKTSFKDVPQNYFASGYIQAAVDAGIISGYDDKTFRPQNKVTRAEMAILISKAFELKNSSAKNNFKDVSPSMASYNAIQALIQSNVTKGYDDGTFRPYEIMTRSQFAVFLARTQNNQLN